jgi:2-iminobutanoate/2-iminopropanoate deaminase
MKRGEVLIGMSMLPLAGEIKNWGEFGQDVDKPGIEWLPKKELINTPAGTCIRSGHLLFIGGIDGWYAGQRVEPGDIQVQIRSVLNTMKGILEGAGSSLSNVLKVQMTVADPNRNIPALNEAYGEFFPGVPPVRSFSGCKASQMSSPEVLCQVSCIAYID